MKSWEIIWENFACFWSVHVVFIWLSLFHDAIELSSFPTTPYVVEAV